MAKIKKNMKSMKLPEAKLLEQNAGGNSLKGKMYGLPFGQFASNLFELNEPRVKKEKWHDGQIAAAIVKEYAEYPNTVEKYDINKTDSKQVRRNIALLRAEYNAGKLVSKSGPASGSKYSFQYDDQGNAVNAKTKDYASLSLEAIRERRDRADERRRKWVLENK